MWFSSFLENDNVFLTSPETRCLNVQLNRLVGLVCPLSLPTRAMSLARQDGFVADKRPGIITFNRQGSLSFSTQRHLTRHLLIFGVDILL